MGRSEFFFTVKIRRLVRGENRRPPEESGGWGEPSEGNIPWAIEPTVPVPGRNSSGGNHTDRLVGGDASSRCAVRSEPRTPEALPGEPGFHHEARELLQSLAIHPHHKVIREVAVEVSGFLHFFYGRLSRHYVKADVPVDLATVWRSSAAAPTRPLWLLANPERHAVTGDGAAGVCDLDGDKSAVVRGCRWRCCV